MLSVPALDLGTAHCSPQRQQQRATPHLPLAKKSATSTAGSSVKRRTVLETAVVSAGCTNSRPESAQPAAAGCGDPATPAFPPEEGARHEKTEALQKAAALGRRNSVLCIAAFAAVPLYTSASSSLGPASARERRQKLDFPLEDYALSDNGLRTLDVEEGKGKAAQVGDKVSVHFEVKYLALSVVSSRESKLLGGNRTIAQPYVFTLGAPPGAERKRDAVDKANALYSAQAAPKPPKALYLSVEGLKIGGKRVVIVPPELGYGDKGYNEIPAGATLTLIIDLLDVLPSEAS